MRKPILSGASGPPLSPRMLPAVGACSHRPYQVVFPTASELAVQIEHPGALSWTRANHRTHFPATFHTVVETMMKCHHRTQNMEEAEAEVRRPVSPTLGPMFFGGRLLLRDQKSTHIPPELTRVPCASRLNRNHAHAPRKQAMQGSQAASPCSSSSKDASVGGWNSPAAQDEHGDAVNLGDLPKDLILEIIGHAAPYVPDIVPISASDLEMYQRGEGVPTP